MILGHKQTRDRVLSKRYILCKPSIPVHDGRAIFYMIASWTNENVINRQLNEKAESKISNSRSRVVGDPLTCMLTHHGNSGAHHRRNSKQPQVIRPLNHIGPHLWVKEGHRPHGNAPSTLQL